MNIIEQINEEYYQCAGYGVTFSIEPDAYDCSLGRRVSFGENETFLQCGDSINFQDVLLDGNVVGYLREIDCNRLFHPITTSFIIPIADCRDEETWAQKEKEFSGNPHLFDGGEVLELRFATLNQMLAFLNVV